MILAQNLHKRIREKKKKLDKLRPLSPALVQRLRDQALIEWTYHSNAIEGSTLDLRETRLILEEGLTIKGKSLREHLEAVNHKEAILYLEKLIEKGKFQKRESLIKQIHSIILKGIDDESAGRYRQVQVRITGSRFVPPNPLQVPGLMADFDKWLRNKRNQKNLIDFAAIAHFKLVDIHPFVDGNGRTARLLMNLILMIKGFPPTVILNTDRARYYRALDQAHVGNAKPFVNFIGHNVERSLVWYLEAVIPEKKKSKEEKWILLSELAPKTPYSRDYLSLLARRGRLEAIKKGKNWYSNLKAVRDYQKSIGR